MTAMIKWSNQMLLGDTRWIDAFYEGTPALESFDLSLVFPSSTVQALRLDQEATGWTIFSNRTDDGSFLVAGILTPGQTFNPEKKLFTLAVDLFADLKNQPSFYYLGSLNSTNFPPSNHAMTGLDESIFASDLVPLQSSIMATGTINAWLDQAEGEIESVSDAVPIKLDTQHFEEMATPIVMKINVNETASQVTMRLFLDPDVFQKGLWITSTTGTWVNLVSGIQGGSISSTEPGFDPTIFQFQVQDGGTMDFDGVADGSVSLVGVIGHINLNLLGRTSALPEVDLWL